MPRWVHADLFDVLFLTLMVGVAIGLCVWEPGAAS